MKSGYRHLNHTSDIKIEIHSDDLPGLFTAAAECLFDTMLARGRIVPDRTETVCLQNTDLAELFLDWLRELLFVFSTRGLAVRKVEMLRIVETESLQLTARLVGTGFDPQRHGFKIEVKTPTYHQFCIKRVHDGWYATVVLDV